MVVVVDDDPDLLRVFGMCLAAEGCDVREALTGAEALAMLERVDVLVVDQHMPEMCGTDLIAAARAKGYAGRTLVISGSDSARTEADLAKSDGFLAKPIGPRELIGEVERLFFLTVRSARPTGRTSRQPVVPTKA